ncbi:hypothetical protein BZG36_05631 [Bifiguratus adelaidae]|uniref:Uncharacterized protein n=1 Tax=Bifiguratus adelaidae TaxID=1938954 RepID=A0A261XVK2_9FUNG|nr:hypothetical protein BZG36_05631 [Bifiguratus adelaidae]
MTNAFLDLFSHIHPQVPIVSAPMAYAAGGALAAEVTKAGGLGLIGAGVTGAGLVKDQVDIAKRVLDIPADSTAILPIGIGYISFHLVQHPEMLEEHLEYLKDTPVAAYWFSFGNSRPLIDLVRQKSPQSKVIVQVFTALEAAEAVTQGVDAIVVQGSEAGGHGHVQGTSTMVLVPEVLDMLHAQFPGFSTPVLAAGGIANGRGVVAAMALGASGVVMGTRFIVSRESLYSEAGKDAVVRTQAGGARTVRGRIFDTLFHYDWPEEYDGRTLRNDITVGLESKEPLENLQKLYDDSTASQDPKGMVALLSEELRHWQLTHANERPYFPSRREVDPDEFTIGPTVQAKALSKRGKIRSIFHVRDVSSLIVPSKLQLTTYSLLLRLRATLHAIMVSGDRWEEGRRKVPSLLELAGSAYSTLVEKQRQAAEEGDNATSEVEVLSSLYGEMPPHVRRYVLMNQCLVMCVQQLRDASILEEVMDVCIQAKAYAWYVLQEIVQLQLGLDDSDNVDLYSCDKLAERLGFKSQFVRYARLRPTAIKPSTICRPVPIAVPSSTIESTDVKGEFDPLTRAEPAMLPLSHSPPSPPPSPPLRPKRRREAPPLRIPWGVNTFTKRKRSLPPEMTPQPEDLRHPTIASRVVASSIRTAIPSPPPPMLSCHPNTRRPRRDTIDPIAEASPNHDKYMLVYIKGEPKSPPRLPLQPIHNLPREKQECDPIEEAMPSWHGPAAVKPLDLANIDRVIKPERI